MVIEQIKTGDMGVFSYIVGHKGEGVVIDPGGDEEKIMKKAAQSDIKLKYVINTHSHPDHTCGNKKICDATGAKIMIHRLDSESLTSQDFRLFGFAMGLQASPAAEILLNDKDTIELGDMELEVIHTPGHTPGSICIHTDKGLFTGDTLFVGGIDEYFY